jgi:hypothetical protein
MAVNVQGGCAGGLDAELTRGCPDTWRSSAPPWLHCKGFTPREYEKQGSIRLIAEMKANKAPVIDTMFHFILMSDKYEGRF